MSASIPSVGVSELEVAKTVLETIQAVVIICATIFTAIWTYQTFSQKERIQELKELRRAIDEYFNAMRIYCASLKPTEVEQQEIQEKMALVSLHNRLVGLSRLNLYTKKGIRERVLGLVGGWIDNRRLRVMVRREGVETDEASRAEAWRQFKSEYDEVSALIEREAGRAL